MRDRLSRKNIKVLAPARRSLQSKKGWTADSRSVFNGSLRSCDAAYLNAFLKFPSNFGRPAD
jgi:hypothetical protein